MPIVYVPGVSSLNPTAFFSAARMGASSIRCVRLFTSLETLYKASECHAQGCHVQSKLPNFNHHLAITRLNPVTFFA